MCRQLASGGYSVPSSIAQELQHNVFMRWGVDNVAKAATGTHIRLKRRMPDSE